MEDFNTIYSTFSVVTTCMPERYFASSLIRIKTYLRFTMGETQLNGLALFSAHLVITKHPERVVDVYEFKKCI